MLGRTKGQGVLRHLLEGLAFAVTGLVLLACGLHIAQSGQDDMAEGTPDALRLATVSVHYINLNQAAGPCT